MNRFNIWVEAVIRNPGPHLVLPLFLMILASVVSFLNYREYKAGQLTTRGGMKIPRDKQPILFWGVILFRGVIAGALFAVAATVLVRPC